MQTFNLAGIVPVAAPELDFNMPWHDSLMPIGKNYLAVERSVLECAYAGCESIWIVCNNSVQPLIRKRIGDYVQDPVWINRKYEKFRNNFRKRIAVYYVPVSVHDQGHKDSLGWSALHGCYIANKVPKKISKKLCPDMFYISFPYGVYDVRMLKKIRKRISSMEGVSLSHNNKTVADGEYLGFTIPWDVAKKLRSSVWAKIKDNEQLPIDERYNIRDLSLADIYSSLSKNDKIEIAEYYNIDNWQSYCEYMGSDTQIKRCPNPILLRGYTSYGLGKD